MIERKVFDLRSSFIDRFVLCLANRNWKFIDDEDKSLDDKCERLHSILQSTLDECIPFSHVRFTQNDKPWITPVVKDLINKRWSAFRSCNFDQYRHLKSKVKVEIQKAKLLWTKKMEQADVWKAVNCHLGRNSSSPIMSLVSQYESVDAAVNAINNCLQSNFTVSGYVDISTLPVACNNDWSPDVSPSTVYSMLNGLSKHKSSPDIPNILYKRAASVLALPLTKLMKLSVEQCSIPKMWKRALVSPIPKTRNPNLDDIRPISLLSPPAKILERIVLNSIKDMLLENYDACQFGFRPGSSTQCALVSLHDQITRHLDDSSTFAVLLLSYDYSKAFDRL